MKKEFSNRIVLMQFICTLSIVLYHIGWKEEFSKNMVNYTIFMVLKEIGVMAVPAFSVMSGFLFFYKVDSWKTVFAKMYRRIFSLVIPYIIWQLGGILYRSRSLFRSFDWKEIIKKVYIGEDMPHLWYLRMLIMFMVLAPIVYFAFKKKLWGAVLLGGLIMAICFFQERVLSSQYCKFLYIVGAYLGLHVNIDMKFENRRIPMWSAVTIFIFLLIMSYLNIMNIISFICHTGMGIMVFYILGSLKNIRIYGWMKNTFWIYAIHYWLDVIVSYCLLQYLPKAVLLNQWLTLILVTAIGITSSIILKKWTPRIYYILVGNR